jgi:hypothetical protein
VTHDDEEIGTESCDNTMKPKNGTRLNPSLGTKPQRWGRPLMKEHIDNGATPIATTVAKLRNVSGSKLIKMIGFDRRTRSSPKTCTVTSPEH